MSLKMRPWAAPILGVLPTSLRDGIGYKDTEAY